MTPTEFFERAVPAAIAAKHIFPDYAACEAALESGWGKSKLAALDNNLFGEKQHTEPIFETVRYDTWEDFNHNGQRDPGETVAGVGWVKFPSWVEAFRTRMATLERLALERSKKTGAPLYPHYGAALMAETGIEFVTEVSKHWATDASRAEKVLRIYRAHQPEIARALMKLA